MERMDGADATFIYTESDRAPGTIGACLVLDDSGDHVHERLVERLRMDTAQDWLYRRRMHRVPLDLHHPMWVEDPDFHHTRHLTRTTSPNGSLDPLLAEIMQTPLDHERPLWHVTHIEGLDGGRSAIVIRTHHAAVDGVGGIQLLTSLLDLEADPPARAAPPEGEAPHEASPEAPPGPIDLVVGAGLDLLRDPLRPVRTAAGLVRDLATSIDPSRRRPTEVIGASMAPPTPFNIGLSGRRSVRLVSLDLAEADAIRTAAGLTVNELVLALVAGTLRRYLGDLDALPDRPLVCYLPMSTGAQHSGNHTTVIPVSLPTDEPDPVRRLDLIGADSRAAKARATGAHQPLILDLSALTGPALGALMERLAVAMGTVQRFRLAGNVVVSNVARVPVPLWSSGAAVLDFFPIGTITDGAAFNVTYLSYDGRLQLTLLADALAVPDPDAMEAALLAEWAELRSARPGG